MLSVLITRIEEETDGTGVLDRVGRHCLPF